VLAVGAGIATAFVKDVKEGEKQLEELSEAIKRTAKEAGVLAGAELAFMTDEELDSLVSLNSKLRENQEEREEATEKQKDAKRMLEVFNGAQATGIELIKARATSELQQSNIYEDQTDKLLLLNAQNVVLNRQIKEQRKVLSALQAGGNPYGDIEEDTKAADKKAKEFLDTLIAQNEAFGLDPIDAYIDGLERQLDALENIKPSQHEAIEAEIDRARALRETKAASDAAADAADREFQAFLAHEEQLDRDTEAMERNRIAKEKLAEEQFSKSLENLRKSLLTEEEAQKESLERRRDIITKALAKEGADKEMLTRLSNRLAEEEATFREQVERRKMNAHDLFKDTALQGLERFREALSDNDKQAAELAQRIDQLADQSMTAFTDSFYDAIVGAKSFEAAFKDMARSIIEDLSKMLIQYYITQSIFGAIVNAFSPKPLVGPTGIEFGPAANHVTRAMGGPVAGGKPYLVGERGPELMVPAGNGTIIPNDSLVGGSVTVVQNINVTTGVQQTVRAEIANLLPQISNAAKAAVADGRMRGGGFGKAMGG
jgi:lambda family phage tail tape measure protein